MGYRVDTQLASSASQIFFRPKSITSVVARVRTARTAPTAPTAAALLHLLQHHERNDSRRAARRLTKSHSSPRGAGIEPPPSVTHTSPTKQGAGINKPARKTNMENDGQNTLTIIPKRASHAHTYLADQSCILYRRPESRRRSPERESHKKRQRTLSLDQNPTNTTAQRLVPRTPPPIRPTLCLQTCAR